MKTLLVWLIKIYRTVFSAMKPVPSCRFHPTCSTYAIDAMQRHGAIKGGWLALRRILRCHPFRDWGMDAVPVSVPVDRHPKA